MKPDLHDRICSILDTVVRLPAERRVQYVEQATRGDEAMIKEVSSLLPYYLKASHLALKPLVPLQLRTALADVGRRAIRDARTEFDEWKPPFSLAPYRILAELGRGGMGIVYVGKHAVQDTEYAIKILRRCSTTEASISRFQREQKVLRHLPHEGIVKVYDGGAARLIHPSAKGTVHRPYFVMEYVRGETLLSYHRKRRLSILDRVALLHQICAAVECAHRNGIVHCDLKPSNILVTSSGTSKVVDFGLATPQLFGQPGIHQKRNEFSGTFAYASPEQRVANGTTLTPEVDVFALGLIAHELFTSVVPRDERGRIRISVDSVGAYSDESINSGHNRLFRYALHRALSIALRTHSRRFLSAGVLGDQFRLLHELFEVKRSPDVIADRILNDSTNEFVPITTHRRLFAALWRSRLDLG